jgi:hypothetical protein
MHMADGFLHGSNMKELLEVRALKALAQTSNGEREKTVRFCAAYSCSFSVYFILICIKLTKGNSQLYMRADPSCHPTTLPSSCE